jgi:hypothetical protein
MNYSQAVSPSPAFGRVADLKRQPSLTVAGPRRFLTGLPFSPLRAPEAYQYDGINIRIASCPMPVGAQIGKCVAYLPIPVLQLSTIVMGDDETASVIL